MDVDGLELSVLCGELDTIAKSKYLIIELRNYTLFKVNKILRNIGFKPIFMEHLHSSGFINKFLNPYVKPDDFNIIYEKL